MSTNKFVNPPENHPFHSSAYAEEANKGRIGSTSSRPFSQRARMEGNRRVVQKYRDSLVARRRHAQHIQRTQGPNLSSDSSGKTFKEPPSRPYNPYR